VGGIYQYFGIIENLNNRSYKMTKENHKKLEALRPEVKSAYITAKGRILDVLREMDLFEGSSLTDEEKNTIYELLNETAFLMKSEENK